MAGKDRVRREAKKPKKDKKPAAPPPSAFSLSEHSRRQGGTERPPAQG